MTWISDDGSIIRHNTFADGACDFGQRCGVINVGAVDSPPPGRPTIIRNNVLGGISNDGNGGEAAFVAQHNLSAEPITGSGNLTGLPRYAGPGDGYTGTAWPTVRSARATRPTAATWASSAVAGSGTATPVSRSRPDAGDRSRRNAVSCAAATVGGSKVRGSGRNRTRSASRRATARSSLDRARHSIR